MKTHSIERVVSSSSVESGAFTISNNAKIFKILIDGLYTNKIQSITREIWSNALDSHVQAGHPERAFDVHLPSAFDPAFRVRDYGVGLSHDMVMHLYTDLGTSTKEDTNAAIGKFGIGSKSPFAYTDNFTITSWFNGEKRYYSAMIGSDGVPGIHLLASEDTDEENGVEVAFPVAEQDTKDFSNAARRVSYGFDVKPNVTNGDFSGWPSMAISAEGTGWRLLNRPLDGHRQQAYARMGPVLYPIDVNALASPGQRVTDLLASPFVIDFAMGDLEITASREDLSYGHREPTANAIKVRAEEIYNEIVGKFHESYAACPTHFFACCKYRDDIANVALPSSIRKLIGSEAHYRGLPLETDTHLNRYRGLGISVIKQKLKNKTLRFNTNESKMTADRKTVVFVEDMRIQPQPKAVAKRLREYYLDNRESINQIVWVRGYSVRSEAPFRRLMEDLDGLPFISEEDLPAYKVNRRGGHSGKRAPVKARRLSRYDSRFTGKVELDDAAFAAGGIYIPLERMQPTGWDLPVAPHRLFATLCDLGILGQMVIGAPKSMMKRFEGENWVEFQAYAKQVLDNLQVDFAAEVDAANAQCVTQSPMMILARDLADGGHAITATVERAARLYHEADACKPIDLQPYRNLYEMMGNSLPELRDIRDWSSDVDAMTMELAQEYPMLDFVTHGRSFVTSDLDIVSDYVIMCDTMRAQSNILAVAAE